MLNEHSEILSNLCYIAVNQLMFPLWWSRTAIAQWKWEQNEHVQARSNYVYMNNKYM